jgi:ABC-type Na+ efflux pump permease subunit
VKSKDAVAAILIVIPFLAYFAIPTYNMVNPEWGGVPFFWWYQTVWLAISAALFFVAAVLMGRKS